MPHLTFLLSDTPLRAFLQASMLATDTEAEKDDPSQKDVSTLFLTQSSHFSLTGDTEGNNCYLSRRERPRMAGGLHSCR